MMRCERGFTLLEIMLVLLLLGITSSLVMLRSPAVENQLARQGEQLAWQLNEVAERAEREGTTYGVAFSRKGWRIVAAGQPQDKTAVAIGSPLPAGVELSLALERQAVSLKGEWPPQEEPQVWLYPGGETTVFSVTLLQGKCQWQLSATGFFTFETTEAHCDEA
ncbi:type II secretion system minor pseudopilin GspH [Serratia plymuthica]|uniref:Type II secretion system protein H n=2 Tax=Serratia plymuthica TaxID=82996 RepID=A0A7T2WCM8_SERPL|nr:type II secretion system minor pseudopilin GspH [Serratia plymuthica]QPS22137.1 type II secretion system minor pseudopilin GspH [Serratia plymuthica]QPS55039.1 type II secretion system minor pseudopilin GspH [Serratia plymuthica]QPS63748.1 type II secretion system minor pseudopilin GspH [Serratia plymuthica]UNK27166.1 type II secretion system minor pseudopilin GspH [Serratia plymuthica]